MAHFGRMSLSRFQIETLLQSGAVMKFDADERRLFITDPEKGPLLAHQLLISASEAPALFLRQT
jgi:hypothetical protein